MQPLIVLSAGETFVCKVLNVVGRQNSPQLQTRPDCTCKVYDAQLVAGKVLDLGDLFQYIHCSSATG